ncbi:hypothetical protein SAMN06264849_11030 [Melghirimyces algeriensis]|uniref:Uncharacterized protein n=1 Tax=Melghirimyces algeriensis TaxID=910412 RepID=A0A521ENY5_9BACL|nr:hypothetical protein SAMN06264849_11030 [Melghirimyces algeriensis]
MLWTLNRSINFLFYYPKKDYHMMWLVYLSLKKDLDMVKTVQLGGNRVVL